MAGAHGCWAGWVAAGGGGEGAAGSVGTGVGSEQSTNLSETSAGG